MNTMTYLIGGVALLLSVASIIGWAIAQRVTSDAARETVRNLNARIKAWWVMVAIFAVAFVFGKAVTILLFVAVSFYCLREF